MDEWGREPGLTDEDRSKNMTMGAYRKGEYWTPKNKFFNESSPPPECPFHNKEDDSPEKQLELDV
jgi:hypothetical protein